MPITENIKMKKAINRTTDPSAGRAVNKVVTRRFSCWTWLMPFKGLRALRSFMSLTHIVLGRIHSRKPKMIIKKSSMFHVFLM
jgi:hypothetical protein